MYACFDSEIASLFSPHPIATGYDFIYPAAVGHAPEYADPNAQYQPDNNRTYLHTPGNCRTLYSISILLSQFRLSSSRR